jgi:CubicO group peptidase (beta-lactamase class C family)
VIRGEEVALGGFGGARPQTVFQIGSVTKVFTALLLADMAERGEVRLSDQAASYLPSGAGTVTLADLATHTSGLPRLPRSLSWYALVSPHDPYARYPPANFLRAARKSLPATSSTAAVPLAAAIRATLQPCHEIPGGEIGLAWHHACRADRRIIWHNGMTGGFSSMIAFDPARSLGVAALANSASSPPSPLDAGVFSAFR